MTVRATIEEYFEALTAGDAARLISLITEQDHFTKIGTDDGEIIRTGKKAPEYYRHHVASTEDFSITFNRLDIQERDHVSWFATEQTWHLKWQGTPEILPLRITGILEREQATWKFVQIHASVGST